MFFCHHFHFVCQMKTRKFQLAPVYIRQLTSSAKNPFPVVFNFLSSCCLACLLFCLDTSCYIFPFFLTCKDLQYYVEDQRIHASNIRLFIRLPGCKTGLGFTRQVLYMLPGILLRWKTVFHKLYTYKLKKWGKEMGLLIFTPRDPYWLPGGGGRIPVH